MTNLSGVSVLELAAVNPSDMVDELQTAARRIPLWPFLAAGLVALAGALPVVGLPLLVIGAPLTWWIGQRDMARRRVVVFYDLESESADRFASLLEAHIALSKVQRAWNHEANAKLRTQYQRKVNAGASSLVRRSRATLSVKGPRILVTNIDVPTLNSPRRSVYFLPDRVLVREGRRFADIPYDSLHVQAGPTRFIEDGPVPTDSEQVGTTWRYVRVDGGPDRRFNNNIKLPIMLYGNLTLENMQGFQTVWEFSQPQRAVGFAGWLRQVATHVGPRGVILPDSFGAPVPPPTTPPSRPSVIAPTPAPAPSTGLVPVADPLAPVLAQRPHGEHVTELAPVTVPARPSRPAHTLPPSPVPPAPVPADEPAIPGSLHRVRSLLYVLSGLSVASAIPLAYVTSRTQVSPTDHPPSLASNVVAYVVLCALFDGGVILLARSVGRGRNWARITLVICLLLWSLSCGVGGLATPASALGRGDTALTVNGLAFGISAFATACLAIISASLLLQSPISTYLRDYSAWRRSSR